MIIAYIARNAIYVLGIGNKINILAGILLLHSIDIGTLICKAVFQKERVKTYGGKVLT